ncbi:hypothetical protein [Mycobacteroides salmoniphilum]|uniref:hypothetical protein n=1 Tax=Mycobacteroides salmoniphilum TaxID=404941 RepID=UPI0010A9B91D|nr:hypothetical protein [Mycobacteroides salmoniphilum]QCH23425.1 hypothetical protein DSM43276_01684 [Mycobacteroides salmoniphilum]
MTPMKKGCIPAGLRRALAAVAITAVAMSGWHLNTNSPPVIGVMGLPGATADPTGPPGPTGGLESGGGSQFQPPGLPPQQSDYQGGINQPPLDQNNGISIYNTGAQGAPQQPGQQGAQQADQGQQPRHGNQIPNYQTATPYTQGPGKTNPDYQAPQQGNQGQQPQQGQQQQPSQVPTQTQQPSRAPSQTLTPTSATQSQPSPSASSTATTPPTSSTKPKSDKDSLLKLEDDFDGVNKILEKSNPLQRDLTQLRQQNWKIRFSGPGDEAGSYTSYGDRPEIVIDSSEKGQPTAIAQTISHEVGHAIYGPHYDVSSKTAYLNGTLDNEGAATMANVRDQQFILSQGGPDIGIAGNQANRSDYLVIYDNYKYGSVTYEQAIRQIGQIFGTKEHPSGDPALTYSQYFGDWYDKAFPPAKK